MFQGSMNPRERLVATVQRLERLTRTKQDAADALRDAFDEARGFGFDPATLKVVLKLRQLTPEQRAERRALEAVYLASLGMLDGEALPEVARRRLDAPPPPPPTEQARGAAPAPDVPEAPPAPPPQPALPLKEPDEARAEGMAAAEAGKRIYDNPYPAGDPCRAAWDEGWCAQNKSHGMDLPTAYQRRTPPKAEGDAPPAPKGDDKGDQDDKRGAA